MNKEFDPDWPHGHVTREGREARIICKDRICKDFPIIALIDYTDQGYESLTLYTKSGKVSMASCSYFMDLVNKQPIQLKVGDVVEDKRGKKGFVVNEDTCTSRNNYSFSNQVVFKGSCAVGRYDPDGTPWFGLDESIVKILKVEE